MNSYLYELIKIESCWRDFWIFLDKSSIVLDQLFSILHYFIIEVYTGSCARDSCSILGWHLFWIFYNFCRSLLGYNLVYGFRLNHFRALCSFLFCTTNSSLWHPCLHHYAIISIGAKIQLFSDCCTLIGKLGYVSLDDLAVWASSSTYILSSLNQLLFAGLQILHQHLWAIRRCLYLLYYWLLLWLGIICSLWLVIENKWLLVLARSRRLDVVRSKNIIVSIAHNADWGNVQIVYFSMNRNVDLPHAVGHIITNLTLIALLTVSSRLVWVRGIVRATYYRASSLLKVAEV